MPVSVLACAVVALALALSACAYGAYVHLLGFPDGFITELSAAERTLAVLFIVVSMAVAVVLAWLAAKPPVRSRRTAILAAVALYAAAIAVTAVADGVLRSTLTGGGGG